MVSLGDFNANEVEPASEFETIPAGQYLAIITASEMKPTKSGAGSFLELTFQIIEGEFQNRNLWARLNLDNQNATAVKIARGELSAICRAVGVITPKDSSDLHNIPLLINVKCRKRDDTGEMTNEIKRYSGPSAQPQSAANDVAPWRR